MAVDKFDSDETSALRCIDNGLQEHRCIASSLCGFSCVNDINPTVLVVSVDVAKTRPVGLLLNDRDHHFCAIKLVKGLFGEAVRPEDFVVVLSCNSEGPFLTRPRREGKGLGDQRDPAINRLHELVQRAVDFNGDVDEWLLLATVVLGHVATGDWG